MKIICPKKPSRTYLFKWTNGIMFSIFGFGLFVVHFEQGWEIRFLHPFNTGKAMFYGDHYNIEVKSIGTITTVRR